MAGSRRVALRAPGPAPAPARPSPPVTFPDRGVQRRAPSFATQVYEVARKDFLQHVRTKRLLIIGLFFFLSLQVVTMVIPLSFDLVEGNPADGEPSHENGWLFISLNASLFGGLFAIELLAIVLTADAICSEWSQRTIFLLLSKPVSRQAFVVGKFLGSLAAVVPAVLVVYMLQYAIMNLVYPGVPSAEEFRRFLAALGMLSLGAVTIASVALFFSALTKSNVLSLIFTLLSVFLVFPIIGAIGDIMYAVDENDAMRSDGQRPDPSSWKYDWSHYASPERVLGAAGPLLIESDNDDFSFSVALIPQKAPERTWLSVISGLVFTGGFLAATLAVVRRRNFE